MNLYPSSSGLHARREWHMASHPDIFTFDDIDNGLGNIRDFQTTGVVAFARGCPLYASNPGSQT
ncbi:hypothetical protein QTQ03_15140 [Micromonospora sp. WMMA1363]|uniref:hypothetical protein n=1 Tax=Micromonospora sp. WMMA1363 TaxID=3053985 RepID=UPI00259C7434|nr:hypothetical protein [Micromonospora sp. WMMA1363]MDM4720860.1 hypothetical protein [Micromonospora sp. WMMA1363]